MHSPLVGYMSCVLSASARETGPENHCPALRVLSHARLCTSFPPCFRVDPHKPGLLCASTRMRCPAFPRSLLRASPLSIAPATGVSRVVSVQDAPHLGAAEPKSWFSGWRLGEAPWPRPWRPCCCAPRRPTLRARAKGEPRPTAYSVRAPARPARLRLVNGLRVRGCDPRPPHRPLKYCMTTSAGKNEGI